MPYTTMVALNCLMGSALIVILFSCISEKSLLQKTSYYFIVLLVCDILMLVTDGLEAYYAYKTWQNPGVRKIIMRFNFFSCANYILYYATMASFVCYCSAFIRKYKRIPSVFTKISLIICIVYAGLWCINVFNGMFITIENGVYKRGDYYIFGQLGGYIVAVLILILLIINFKNIKLQNFLVMFVFIIIPVFTSIARRFLPNLTLQIGMSFAIFMNYIFVHINQAQIILKQEKRLVQKNTSLMVSQIQPHFIFNSLNSIYVLCDKDSGLAKKAIGDFSTYLRENLLFMELENLIPFEKEIEHLNHYLNLEKLRFREDLNVVFDLQERDFKIPALTVQPIVENAIKHGLRKKEGSGTVAISSYKENGFFVIKVADDGAGFDKEMLNFYVSELKKTQGISRSFSDEDEDTERWKDGEKHIGIKNVKERLWAMCEGELAILSEEGKTEVFIKIPIQMLSGGGYNLI